MASLRYWEVGVQAVRVGDTAVTVSLKSAIIDSGTTAIVMPDADVTAIHRVGTPNLKKLCEEHKAIFGKMRCATPLLIG